MSALSKTSFENDGNSLKDYVGSGQERPLTQLPKTTPSQEAQLPNTSILALGINSNPGRTHADRYCICRGEENKRKLLSIIEYKPPQKLTTGKLNRVPKNVPKDRNHRWN